MLSGFTSHPTFEDACDLAATGAATAAQSVFRGFRARRRCVELREARADLDCALLEHEQEELARSLSGTTSTSRGQCAVFYGTVSTNCHGYDATADCSRASGGQTKLFKAVSGNPNSAEGMAMSQFTLLSASVHANTNKTYQSGSRPWFSWRILSGLDPYIRSNATEAVKEQEQELMDFYCYHAEVVNWTPSWLHVQLYAILFYHMLLQIPKLVKRKV